MTSTQVVLELVTCKGVIFVVRYLYFYSRVWFSGTPDICLIVKIYRFANVKNFFCDKVS